MKEKSQESLNRRQFVGQTAKAMTAFMILPRFVLGGKKPDGTLYIPPSDRTALGFIGTGKQGRTLSEYFLKTEAIRIVAMSEVYQAKAQLFKDKVKTLCDKTPAMGTYSDIPLYNDMRELLQRKDVDAVVIALPDHWHAAAAVRAAEAGKDVYCEKPMALTIKEGRAMVNAIRKNHRVFQTGSMQRSWPEFRQAVELVRNGYIGEVTNVKVNVGPPPVPYTLAAEPIPEGLDWTKWLGPNDPAVFNSELAPPTSKDVFPDWRKYREFGGGGVTDWGAHMFDIVQWALDMDHSGPIEVHAPGGEYQNLTFRYANGTIMTHEKWEWNNAIHFIGTKGEIKIQRGKLETSPEALKTHVFGSGEKRVYFSDNHYKDFLQAMQTRKPPICDVETGHRTATVCNLANIAYRIGQSFHWDPKKETTDNAEANGYLGRTLHNEWAIKM